MFTGNGKVSDETMQENYESSIYVPPVVDSDNGQPDVMPVILQNYIIRQISDGVVEFTMCNSEEEKNGTQENKSTMNERGIDNEQFNVPTPDLDPDARNDNQIKQTRKTFKEEVPNSFDTQELCDMLKITCVICKEIFDSITLFRKHMISHKASKTFNCPKCAVGFNIENNLKIHMVTAHNTYRDVCPICKLQFHRMASLKSHILIHQVEELLLCEECDAEFESEEELLKHMENHARSKVTHSNDNTLVCSYCKLEFEELTEYKKHISLHVEVRKNVLRGKKSRKRKATRTGLYSCKQCGKLFAKNCLLLRHERIHTGEKPFICPICSKGFSQKSTLQIHMSHHTGVKQFSCTLCTAKFYQKGNLRAHIEKTHTAPKDNQKMYKCSQCTCIFKKIATLNGHMTKVHVNQVDSELNTEQDILAQVLNNLKVLESQRCPPSPKTIENESIKNGDESSGVVKLSESHASGSVRRYLVKQKKVGDVRWYFCNYCPKGFKKPSDLIRHIRIHTQEKPFKCSKCHASFTLKSTLLTHMKTHVKELTCPFISCDSIFKNSKTFNAHVRAHEKTNVPNYYCVLCKHQFWTIEECKSHRKMHENEIPEGYNIIEPCLQQPLFQTPYGSLSVKPPKSKIPNSGTESPLERPHSCSICDARFTRLLSLRRHLQYHNGEKKFKCSLCSKAFLTNYRLKEHLNYHKNIRNYTCQICNKKFVTASLLKRHLIVHNTFRPYSCPYCKKDFKTLLLCRTHITQVHKLDGALVINKGVNSNSQEVDKAITTDDLNSMSGNNQEQDAILLGTIVQDSDQVNYQTVYLNLADVEMPTDNNLTRTNVFSTLKLQAEPLLFNSMSDIHESNMLFNNDKPSDTVDPNIVIKSTTLNNCDSEKNLIPEKLVCLKSGPTVEETRLIDFPSVDLQQPLEDEGLNPITQDNNLIENDMFYDAQVMCIHCHKVCPDMDHFQQHTCNKEVIDTEIGAIPAKLPQAVTKKTETLDKNVKNDKTVFSKCKVCKQTFDSESQYKRHVIYVHGEGKICRYCLKEFQKPSDLKRHLRTHTGERPYGCILCEKKFSLKSTLDTHMKTHDAIQKSIVCEVCNSAFSSKSSLKVHMLLHTGERPYSCTFCNQTFRTATIRKAHENVNHLRKCRPQASKNKNATKLLKSVADEVVSNVRLETNVDKEQTIITKTLNEECINKEVLSNLVPSETLNIDPLILLQQMQHSNLILTDSNETVPINLSEITFLDCKLVGVDGNSLTMEGNETPEVLQYSLVQDDTQKIPSFNVEDEGKQKKTKKETQKVECNICHKMYASKDVLRKHKKKVHGQNKKFPCIKCDKGYDNLEELNRHIKLHTGYRPFSCQYCPNSFTEEQNLKTHVKRIHQKSVVSQETANALMNLHFDLPMEAESSIL